jgi:hypothetical protein
MGIESGIPVVKEVTGLINILPRKSNSESDIILKENDGYNYSLDGLKSFYVQQSLSFPESRELKKKCDEYSKYTRNGRFKKSKKRFIERSRKLQNIF